jgi:fatty acid desaturase
MQPTASPSDSTIIDAAMGTDHLPGRDVLDRATLQSLSERADGPGLRHLAAHLAVILATGWLLSLAYAAGGFWALPALILHGFALVTLFAPTHEAGHATAFKSLWLGKAVAWVSGTATLNNADFYRRFHHWHHRYTQVPGQDPELGRAKPTSWGGYASRLVGLYYFRDRLADAAKVALYQFNHPYIPERSKARLAWSARAQFAVYGLVIVGSIVFQTWAAVLYWALPLVFGQPVLRAILLAEHTGCTEDSNGLTNTRTTLASWPIRFLMWNMPYHAEHHLHPAVPFHRLPELHRLIKERLTHISPSYPAAQREIIATFDSSRTAEPQKG